MKEKILQTTARLISKNGVHSTSTRAICAEMGITAPTLYYYFADKDLLFDSVMNHSFESHFDKIKRVTTGEDPIGDLQAAWDAYMQFVNDEPDLYSIMINCILRGQVPEAGVRCLEDLVEKFGSHELKGRLVHDARKSAAIYLSTAQGIAVMSLADKSSATKKKDLQSSVRDLILNSLIMNPQEKRKQ